MPPIVCLIGRPNSGKTTLLEHLLPILKRGGYRIGTVKHHAHTFEMDTPGKDSWRHKQAGAEVVALSSPTGLGIIRDVESDTPLAQLVADSFSDMDLVLAEGYKDDPLPKIEVLRSAIHPQPWPHPDANWIAYVSDIHPPTKLPVFSFDQTDRLAAFLIEKYITHSRNNEDD